MVTDSNKQKLIDQLHVVGLGGLVSRSDFDPLDMLPTLSSGWLDTATRIIHTCVGKRVAFAWKRHDVVDGRVLILIADDHSTEMRKDMDAVIDMHVPVTLATDLTKCKKLAIDLNVALQKRVLHQLLAKHPMSMREVSTYTLHHTNKTRRGLCDDMEEAINWILEAAGREPIKIESYRDLVVGEGFMIHCIPRWKRGYERELAVQTQVTVYVKPELVPAILHQGRSTAQG